MPYPKTPKEVADKVISMGLAGPCVGFELIASKLGISVGTAWKIWKERGFPPKPRIKPRRNLCINCGTEFTLRSSTRIAHFCSAECEEEYYRAILVCDMCGVEFSRSIVRIRNRVKTGASEHFFCSRECAARFQYLKRVGLK